MKAGVTGSRHGFSASQAMAFRRWAAEQESIDEFHHGSCSGVDVEAARIVRELHPGCRIIAHPGPEDCPHQADSGVDDEALPGKGHFARNRDIVNCTEFLAGFPFSMGVRPDGTRMGGTWYTIEFARKVGRPHIVVSPDGVIT